jgi:hypothetical protein
MLFRRELPDHEQGYVISPGITSLWTKNPAEEQFSSRNHQIIDPDSDRKDQNAQKTSGWKQFRDNNFRLSLLRM